MTIFVKSAKDLINRVLTKSIEDAIADDKALFSFLRNKDLSDKQKTLTRDLQKKMDSFVGLDTDEYSLVAFKKLISTTDTLVEELRKQYHWPRGHLNETLTKLNSTLDRFYNTISGKTFKLVDIQDNTDPFNILCFYSAYYLGEHIICPPKEDIFTKAIDALSSQVSISPVEIRNQKEDCLVKNLIDCKKKLDGLDTEREEYNELRLTHVTDSINAIIRKNAEICEESKIIAAIPVQLSLATAHINASAIKPSRGRLRVAMENALDDIKDLCIPKQQPTLSMQ